MRIARTSPTDHHGGAIIVPVIACWPDAAYCHGAVMIEGRSGAQG
jgi:hypothetical protein